MKSKSGKNLVVLIRFDNTITKFDEAVIAKYERDNEAKKKYNLDYRRSYPLEQNLNKHARSELRNIVKMVQISSVRNTPL